MADVARALSKTDTTEEALTVAQQTIDSALVTKDPILYHYGVQTKVRKLLMLNRDADATDLIAKLLPLPFCDATDSLLWARSMATSEAPRKALELIRAIRDSLDPKLIEQTRYLAFRNMGMIDSFLIAHDRYDNIQDKVWNATTTLHLNHDLADWYTLNRQLDEQKITTANLRWGWTISIGGICLAILIILFLVYRHRKKILFSTRLEGITALQNSKNQALIKELFHSQYALIEEIASIYIKSPDEKKAYKKAAEMINALIKDYSNQKHEIDRLGELADKYYDNVFSDFKADMPKILEKDLLLFLFTIFGISTPAVTLLLKEKDPRSVYSRRQRVRKRIIALGKPKSTRYLHYLGVSDPEGESEQPAG